MRRGVRRTTDGGRPSRRRRPPARFLGIDIGGTKASAVVVDRTGRIRHRAGTVLHDRKDPPTVVARILRLVDAGLAARPGSVRAIGVGVAAQVDSRQGLVLHAGNLGWGRVALGPRIARHADRPVRLINDAMAATYGEWRVGAGRGARHVFGLSLGTGVGGGMIVDGRLALGSHGAFGEVGHMTIVSGGRPCTCGHRGCWEAYVGGWAVAERAREAVRAERRSGRLPVGFLDPRARPWTARQVFAAHRAGDPIARRVVRETLDHLANGAVGIANAFDPGLIVLVGGWIAGLPEAVERVRRAIRTSAQPTAARTRVRAGLLGEDAVAVGAALFARDGAVARAG